MFKKVLIGIAAVVAVLAVVVAMQPAEYALARSATMAAPPAKVFGMVNTIRRFNDWSPFAKMDPEAKITYEGPEAGEGAAQSWAGAKSGEGTMTLVTSRPNSLIEFRLDFRKPMASTATAEFSFKQEGQGTVVTWTMKGRNTFVAKALHLVMNMERMIGPEFEKGLADLKILVEAPKRK
jgi:uncharacterized protein YndB with AHSA1/START domain